MRQLEVTYKSVVRRKFPNPVAIFGSARYSNDHPVWRATNDLAYALGKNGCSILTGGGPGVMAAANFGAFAANARSVGFRICLPSEQCDKPVQWHSDTFNFEDFHFRQESLIRNAERYVVMPGGFGTLYELYNVLTLMQCQKMPKSTVWLYGRDHFAGHLDLAEEFAMARTINFADLNLFKVTDNIEDIIEDINDGFNSR